MSSKTALSLTDAVATAMRISCAQQLDFAQSIAASHAAIREAVDKGCDLDAMWLESDEDKRHPGHYRRHQVHTDEEFGFTVVVLLWEPGACTPIHDHDTWCVFACLRGEMEVTNYEVVSHEGKGGPLHLRECSRESVQAFAIGDNSGVNQEVHRVRNTGAERAVSLHVYGSDLTKRVLFDGRGIRVAGKEACFAYKNDPAY